MKLASFFSLMACLLFLAATPLSAQKMAHVDGDAIIPNMPAYKRAKAEVESYGKILQKQLEAESKKVQDFYTSTMEKAQQGLLSPAQQKQAEEQLQKMQQALQQKSAEAERSLAKKEQDLIKPLYEQFNKALTDVAAENGYSYIMDVKLIMYSEGGIDATSKVKAKLGI
ncbi:OmpH family outer membrane protein [Saprospira grandis]|uniref:Outer membrane chaperone Skp (OmpH) n=1 Tax=Saprospira grandis (strain Lewin) TaxID=984262 RepID=H6L9R4_SAPGL|nr:OmpH family outer membrane protein [Saprospira grandis]AFC23242.1 outer membrane chaperone Skp (OmpH) [Saprospira grandis str. Lewin]